MDSEIWISKKLNILQNISFSLSFKNLFRNVKTIFCVWAVEKQERGWIWPTGCGCQPLLSVRTCIQMPPRKSLHPLKDQVHAASGYSWSRTWFRGAAPLHIFRIQLTSPRDTKACTSGIGTDLFYTRHHLHPFLSLSFIMCFQFIEGVLQVYTTEFFRTITGKVSTHILNLSFCFISAKRQEFEGHKVSILT